jgi:hypothetical protein
MIADLDEFAGDGLCGIRGRSPRCVTEMHFMRSAPGLRHVDKVPATRVADTDAARAREAAR